MSPEIKHIYLVSHPLFAGLDERQLKFVSSLARMKMVQRGDKFDCGDGDQARMYLLIKGKIKITNIDEADNELIKDILMAADVFGSFTHGAANLPTDEYAQALTDNTVICYFQMADLEKMIENCPLIALNYAHTVNAKLKRMEQRHSDLILRDTKTRLIQFIRNWALAEGSRMGDKIVFDNYLTHNDIAGMISTTRQTVSMFLNELRHTGFLLYSRDHIELHDPLLQN